MSLYRLERSGNVQEIIHVLRTSDNPQVRKRAADALAEFEEHDDRSDVVRALVRTATEDANDEAVAAAVDSLARLGQDALEELIGDVAGTDMGADQADWVKAKAFMKVLNAEVPELRMAAANGLGELDQSDAVPELVERLADPDPRVRARAARACGRIGDPRAIDGLESLLTDRYAGVRREAADALGKISNRSALDALLPLYDDDDERVRRIVVDAFGHFSNDQPVEQLANALDDPSAPVRRTAVYSIVQVLSNVPTDRSHDIREQVLEQLQATDDGSVVEPLVKLLQESTGNSQRRNSAWLLGRVVESGDDHVLDALVDALEDEDTMTAQFAATSLVEIGTDDVESALLERVDDPDVPVDARAQAVFALGKVGGEPTRRRLETLLDETEHEPIRKRAFSALSKIGGQ